jgi:hypothetical protein
MEEMVKVDCRYYGSACEMGGPGRELSVSVIVGVLVLSACLSLSIAEHACTPYVVVAAAPWHWRCGCGLGRLVCFVAATKRYTPTLGRKWPAGGDLGQAARVWRLGLWVHATRYYNHLT